MYRVSDTQWAKTRIFLCLLQIDSVFFFFWIYQLSRFFCLRVILVGINILYILSFNGFSVFDSSSWGLIHFALSISKVFLSSIYPHRDYYFIYPQFPGFFCPRIILIEINVLYIPESQDQDDTRIHPISCEALKAGHTWSLVSCEVWSDWTSGKTETNRFAWLCHDEYSIIIFCS